MDVTCYVAACCAIQTECDECTNVYKVNSITYCCPGCKGDVLVNGLICTCTVVYSSDERHQPNCTISNKVIGDYYFGRTSWNSTANLTTSRTSLTTTADWYSAANLPAVSTPLLPIALCLVLAIRYWSGL